MRNPAMRGSMWLGTVLVGAGLCAQAQWLNQPIPGAPRTRDGKVNLAAPAPRAHGKPDLSGLWQVEGVPEDPRRGPSNGLGESARSKYFINVLADFKPGEEVLTPSAAAIFRERLQSGGNGYPGTHCLPDGVPHGDLLPQPFKIIQIPGEIVMLYEVETTFRQVFMDGRKQLTDPQPSWMGYSVGKWEGDTLVVDTVGFNDLSWLDAMGHGHSEALRVEERFHRRDFGHLDVAVTMDDPKTFTKPIVIKFVEQLLPDTDLLEHYCSENEKDVMHQPRKP
jgi:hypothetical protein